MAHNMLLLIDRERFAALLSKLTIPYEPVRVCRLKNAVLRAEHRDNLFFETDETAAETEFRVVRIDRFEMWKLDTVLGHYNTLRRAVAITDGILALRDENDADDTEPLYAYFALKAQTQHFRENEYLHNTAVPHALPYCDVYLMVPGRMELSVTDVLPNQESSSDFFCDIIFKRLVEETEEGFIRDICRCYLGVIDLVIPQDFVEKRRYVQKARLYLTWHKSTGFCVLEFMVLNCEIGGNKVNNYFGGNGFMFALNGYEYSMNELLSLLEITPYGKKRSVIFAYGDVSRKDTVNALANEEYAMGALKGKFAELLDEDIAIYDTAKVYVSTTTMFEACSTLPDTLQERVSYQSVELFFVELLLFQDASVDRIYRDLRRLQKNQSGTRDYEKAIEQLDSINEELSDALVFSDYDHFLFPTTRMSSERIANAFGLPAIFEKYKQNIEILNVLMESNKRKSAKKQDKIKNKFLFLLTFLSALGTFGEIIYVSENKITPLNAYVLASIVIILVFSFYKLLMSLSSRENRPRDDKNRRH